MHYTFSLYYSIDPVTAPAMPDNTHVISFEEGYLDGEDPLNQWNCPNSSDEIPTGQPRDVTHKSNQKIPWYEDTNPPYADQSKNQPNPNFESTPCIATVKATLYQ